ncbi:MAG: hypothetical protein WCB27_26365 [Thermoguttaceae bacterium]|jgi:hypothetical protein
MVQLNLKFSNRHILPVLILFLLVIPFGDLGEIFQCGWWSAVGACALMVVVAIVSFYFALAFINIAHLKESYLGEHFFGWRLDRTVIMRWLVALGIFFTYYAFVCRVFMIAAIEALFVGMLLTTAIGHRLDLFAHPSWAPYWWVPTTVLAAAVHTWVERSRLGRAALIIRGEVDAQDAR